MPSKLHLKLHSKNCIIITDLWKIIRNEGYAFIYITRNPSGQFFFYIGKISLFMRKMIQLCMTEVKLTVMTRKICFCFWKSFQKICTWKHFLNTLCSIMQHFLKWKQLFNIGTCFKWYTINQKIHVTSSLLKSRKQLKISLMALGSF